MPADNTQFRPSVRRFFTRLARWQPDPERFVNIHRDALPADELERKAKRYANVIAKAAHQARIKPDMASDWDTLVGAATSKMTNASLYYLFTGSKSALRWATEALDMVADCERPHFCYSTLIGKVDIDLRTAGVTRALATMRTCFADVLDADTRRRLDRIAIQRCLRPAREALRARKYWWSQSRNNWRSVVTGSFGMGAMAFADVFSDWRELLEYGLEGVLAVLEDGDRAGGWQEGPGYWEYGIGHCAEFAAAVKLFTGGEVDLFQHPYLKRTGDFRVCMSVGPGHVWNWSDGGKAAAGSLTLLILARAYGNGVYQAAALEKDVPSIRHLFYLDPGVRREAPAARTGFAGTKIFPDIRVAVMRTGFGRSDAFVGVKAGAIGPGVNHEHADLGSVVIHAAGRELLAEVEHWTYAQADGKAGGFFDRAGKRWDYDGNAVVGHNLVMLEGRYPPFTQPARASLKHFGLGGACELIVVDSTAMHQALARLVRRYVVFLPPDVLLLVDHIRARESIRARCLFHYLARAETGEDSFTITNGGAQLRGRSLHPSVEHNVIVGRDVRHITYHTERGPMQRTNAYVYTANLHRSKELVFVTGLQFGRKPLAEANWTLEGDPQAASPFAVTVQSEGARQRVRFDLAAGAPVRVSLTQSQ